MLISERDGHSVAQTYDRELGGLVAVLHPGEMALGGYTRRMEDENGSVLEL